MRKKVSVIVPVYNVENYIKRCLDSLVHQTLEDIEIIVVNDGSPDNSQKIIDKYVKKYPNKVKSYIKENGGQGSARNYGLDYATGEYVGYVDSDDYVELDMFEKMYNFAIKKKSDVVICDCYCVYEDSDEKSYSSDRRVVDNNRDNAFFGKTAVWNKIYKRELLVKNKLQFRSNVWYEDFDFTLNVLGYAKKVEYLEEALYNYLIREGSTMNNSNILRNLEIIEAFDAVKDNDKIDKDILEYLAIEHLLLATSTRVINAQVKLRDKVKIIKQLKDYMKVNFKNFLNNKYFYVLSKGKRIALFLILTNQFWLFERAYRFMCKRNGGK